MSSEHLHPPETNLKTSTPATEPEFLLSTKNITILCAERRDQLEQLQKKITPKFFSAIKEKLLSEQRQFLALLNTVEEHKQTRAQYSHILNPYFFEQKFLK